MGKKKSDNFYTEKELQQLMDMDFNQIKQDLCEYFRYNGMASEKNGDRIYIDEVVKVKERGHLPRSTRQGVVSIELSKYTLKTGKDDIVYKIKPHPIDDVLYEYKEFKSVADRFGIPLKKINDIERDRVATAIKDTDFAFDYVHQTSIKEGEQFEGSKADALVKAKLASYNTPKKPNKNIQPSSKQASIDESSYWNHLCQLTEKAINKYPAWSSSQNKVQKTENLMVWLKDTIKSNTREAEIIKKVLTDLFEELT